MRAYIIDAGTYTQHERVDNEWGGPAYEYRGISVVCAETRGQAKSMFFQGCDYRKAFEWTSPMTIRLVATDVEYPAGPTDDFALWQAANALLGKLDESEEWANWQAVGDLYYAPAPEQRP